MQRLLRTSHRFCVFVDFVGVIFGGVGAVFVVFVVVGGAVVGGGGAAAATAVVDLLCFFCVFLFVSQCACPVAGSTAATLPMHREHLHVWHLYAAGSVCPAVMALLVRGYVSLFGKNLPREHLTNVQG